MNKNDVLRMLALAATLILFGMSAPVWAATQTTTTYDHDTYGEPWGGGGYDISKMVVSWDSNDTVRVNVYTDFAGDAGKTNLVESRSGRRGGRRGNSTNYINYGDLLIGTGGSGWDYAFHLGDSGRSSNSGGTGWLVEIGATKDVLDYHPGFDEARKNQIVAVSAGSTLDTGSWSVGNGVISFAFNVASLNLSDSAQLAFRWAQTCANDIAMGVGKQPGGYTPPPPPPGNTIPEPAVLGLMLAGFAGLGFTRRRPKECLVA